jgi:hypothetical protein
MGTDTCCHCQKGFDSVVTIPADRLGFALRAYEPDHPDDGLRELLTKKRVAGRTKLVKREAMKAIRQPRKALKAALDAKRAPKGE